MSPTALAELLHKQDEDGRPLGESAAGIIPRRGPCPYTDGRAGQPMNLDALEQVRRSWTELLSLLSAAAASEAPTVHGAWRATSRCLALAASSRGPVPRVWSALWKVTLGYHQTFTLLILDRDLGPAPLIALGTGEQFAAWCAREQLLIGVSEVCAGSPRWIARGFDALRAPEPGPFPLAPGDGERFMRSIAADLRTRQAAFLAGQALAPGKLSWQVDGRSFSVSAIDRLVPG